MNKDVVYKYYSTVFISNYNISYEGIFNIFATVFYSKHLYQLITTL